MSLNRSDYELSLSSESTQISVTFNRIDETNGSISWNLPPNIKYYDGAVVLLSSIEPTHAETPVDGVRYSASQDMLVPADLLGQALVAGALYGDKITTSINIINLDPNKIYFAVVFPVTNTLHYYDAGRRSYVAGIRSDSFSGDIPQSSTPPLNPTIGQVYYNSTSGKVMMWNSSAWMTVNARNVITGKDFPANPTTGDFFYNSTTDKLYGFDGTSWTQANTASEGIPTYDKVNVGSDGSSDDYKGLTNVLKRRLGWPTMCVELTDEHFYESIENAIQEFRRRADNAYRHEYFFLTVNATQQMYYLNDPESGTNRIAEIMKIHRFNTFALTTFGENGLYAQQFLRQYYDPRGGFDFVSIHLIHSMGELFNNIFAGDISFNWNEAKRELHVHRRFNAQERVLVEASTERTKQELLNDRYVHPWLEDWALAECTWTLGMIRSKFSTVPGPGGGVSLNGSELLSNATADFDELRRQINDLEVGNGGGEFGQHSFVIG